MQNFDAFILSFEKKLHGINADDVTDHAYGKSYFLHLQQNLRYYLSIYAHVLQRLQQHSPVIKEQMALVDYGAGNGLLGLFAKHCGFGKVYINDIEANFLRAAEKLSDLLSIRIDGFIKGDIDAVCKTLAAVPPHAVIGTDVIEHIYDLDLFFASLKKLNPQLIAVFTTAANTANWFKTKRLKELQMKDEYEGGQPGDYALFGGEAIDPFQVTRKKIIHKNFPSIPAEELQQFSLLTRGLKEDDIVKAVEKYITDKILPTALKHPTNTCDPLTGSWTERLLTIKEYETIYCNAGFKLKIYNGFYNEFTGGIKSLFMKSANIGIRIMGKSFAPFITLVGKT